MIYIPDPDLPWYCGPHSLAVLTGCSFDNAVAILNKHMGLRPTRKLRGLDDSHPIIGALIESGYEALLVYRGRGKRKPTLGRFLATRRLRGPHLVELRDHFVVIDDDGFIDTETLDLVPFDKAPRMRCRVHRVYRVIPIN